VNIPVPENVQPDGTIQEAHTSAVEIVQLWKVVPSHGYKLFLVR